MKTIPLSNGGHAIVDDQDYEELARYAWHMHEGYPRRSVGQGRARAGVYMHYFLMPRIPGYQIDHANRDRLDNRRENLRYAEPIENKRNREKVRTRKCTSRYIGVYRNKKGSWIAQVRINGKLVHIGSFDDEEEAARRRDEEARKHYGKFANLNFPDDELADEIAA